MPYDSAPDTRGHIQLVGELLWLFVIKLQVRLQVHDASKLKEPEKSLFDKYTPLLRETTYGSPEYWKLLEEMRPALAHHYENNSHHPEHYLPPPDPELVAIADHIDRMKEDDPAREWLLDYLKERRSRVNSMSLLDIIEMLADWKAAGHRHEDGSLEASLEINRKRFEISPQLFHILRNTVEELEW